MEIRGKIAVITGGAQGMGRQFAEDLAKEGANVVICDINEDGIKEVVDFAKQQNLKIDGYRVNVTDEKDVEDFFENIGAKYNGIDIVINNAGIARDSLLIKKSNNKIEKFLFKSWKDVIDVNLTGVFLTAREAAYQMVKYNKKGVIISISSISRHGNIGQTNYSATKAGVSAMTVTWAKELARYGIRVVAIAPGYIETEMTANIPDKVRDKLISMIPLGRFGKKEEISKTIKFVIENDYITGRTIEIDGGLRI